MFKLLAYPVHLQFLLSIQTYLQNNQYFLFQDTAISTGHIGLSRYNLFTPQSFIYILNKLRNEFGWDRIRNILPTGGQGTLTSYYLKGSGFIFAKTGTLSNHYAISGFLITNRGKLLIFSILANHYKNRSNPRQTGNTAILSSDQSKILKFYPGRQHFINLAYL